MARDDNPGHSRTRRGVKAAMAHDPDDPGTLDMFDRLSPVQRRLLDAQTAIHDEPPSPADRAFIARQLVQATLPHSDPGDVPIWRRHNGALTLTIRPHFDRQDRAAYPYGTVPRLLLFWLTGEAARTQNRRLELGGTLAEFMREVGLNPDNGSSGAKRSDARRLRDQMERLFRAVISFDYADDARASWRDMQVAPSGEFWWDARQPDHPTLWGSWVELGERFYEALIAAPIPVDRRAIAALKRSPLQLDLYAWAVHRAFSATQAGKPAFVSFRQLQQQLGTDYAENRDFKKALRTAMDKVRRVYPALLVDDAEGGILVKPSAPAVPR
jgi:hypothetical protein